MRKMLGLFLKIAITAALLYLTLGRVDLTGIGERLQRIEPAWLAGAIVVISAQTVLLALRWRIVARQCGAGLSAARALRFTLIAAFFNQTLPSTIGGDAARLWLLAREGAGWAKAAYSVLVDRAFGLMTLAAIVLLGLPLSFRLIADPTGRATLFVIGFGCVAAAAVFVLMGTRRLPLLGRYAATRHLENAAAAAYATMTHPRSAAAVLGLSLAIHAATFLTAWLVAQSVAAPLSLLNAVLLVPPVLLVASVPLSIAGWGVRESAMVLAFSYAGLQESDGLLVSLLLGATLFALGIFGGLVWLVSPDATNLSEREPDGADPRASRQTR